ncbi:MAG TPA: lysophospholipid acyltransferase family protein [Paludibacter sp.]|nr:lysophospholipid acyltransferase family protein [Paludibacter sp.]
MQELSKWLLKKAGWKAVITIDEPAKSVICVAPHTSNWDFIIGKLFYWSLNRQSSFLMKKSWFFFPLGYVLRNMGGIPIDRSLKTSVTEQMAEVFNTRSYFHLAITPEGTRKKVDKWKMGFYYIALKANVPIQLAYIDYKKKEMGIAGMIFPTGDEKADLHEIRSFYQDVAARFPDKFNKNI